jgi:hypothetical protein
MLPFLGSFSIIPSFHSWRYFSFSQIAGNNGKIMFAARLRSVWAFPRVFGQPQQLCCF